MSYEKYLPEDIRNLYEIYNYRNAVQILATSAPDEFNELIKSFLKFRLTIGDIRKPGGNESDIPKKISVLLRKLSWLETRIAGDLIITKTSNVASKMGDDDNDDDEGESDTLEKIEEQKKKGAKVEKITLKNFLDGHKVDYVKNRVAFDLEWNSKDQTFDRDLYAFRAFYECNLIDAAVLMTRDESLNEVFEKLGPELDSDGKPIEKKNGKPKLIKEKYGASTTWMGKLIPRIESGRSGGCPILVLGIKPALIEDWQTS